MKVKEDGIGEVQFHVEDGDVQSLIKLKVKERMKVKVVRTGESPCFFTECTRNF